MVDCSVDQVGDCGFTAAWELLRDCYSCRREVTPVEDCSVRQSAGENSGFEVFSGKSVIVILVDGR